MGKRRTRDHKKGIRKTNRRRVAKRVRKTRSIKMRRGNIAVVAPIGGKAAQYYDDNTNLHNAASVFNYDKVKSLLNSGEDIYALDSNNKTVLHRMVENYTKFNENNLHVIEMLLNKDKESNEKDLLNFKDTDGKTALHYAVNNYLSKKNDTTELVELLLKKDAFVNIKDNEKKTVIHYASKDMNLLKLLINGTQQEVSHKNTTDRNEQLTSELWETTLSSLKENIRIQFDTMKLFGDNEDFILKDDQNNTFLHYAIYNNSHKNIIESIIEKAIQEKGYIGISKLIISKNNKEETPISLCRKNKEYGDVYAKELIDKRNKEETNSDIRKFFTINNIKLGKNINFDEQLYLFIRAGSGQLHGNIGTRYTPTEKSQNASQKYNVPEKFNSRDKFPMPDCFTNQSVIEGQRTYYKHKGKYDDTVDFIGYNYESQQFLITINLVNTDPTTTSTSYTGKLLLYADANKIFIGTNKRSAQACKRRTRNIQMTPTR